MADELDALLAEQMAYYRARAGEYDATSPLPRDDDSRTKLLDALQSFAPRGRVPELAYGSDCIVPAAESWACVSAITLGGQLDARHRARGGFEISARLRIGGSP